MSRSLNRVTLIGHVGSDPDVHLTSGGRKVANFSLATNENWTDESGQEHEEVSWHKCEAWGGHADVIETWVKKGQQLMVEGRIKYTTSENEKGKTYYTSIVVSNFIMLAFSGQKKAKRPEFILRGATGRAKA